MVQVVHEYMNDDGSLIDYHLLTAQYSLILGFRRVWAEVDERHAIAKRFLSRSGWTLEAVLHKHRIVQKRNRNSAIYVMLNSDWSSGGARESLRKKLGLSPEPTKTKKAIRIDSADEIINSAHNDGKEIRSEKNGNKNENEISIKGEINTNIIDKQKRNRNRKKKSKNKNHEDS